MHHHDSINNVMDSEKVITKQMFQMKPERSKKYCIRLDQSDADYVEYLQAYSIITHLG